MNVDSIPGRVDTTAKGRQSNIGRIAKFASQYGIFVFLVVLIIVSGAIATSSSCPAISAASIERRSTLSILRRSA